VADVVVSVNSEAEWEAGGLDGCNALDPAGKLTLGVSSATIAEYVSEGALAVFIRCREGTGTTLENPGLAGDGTLSNADAWRTRDDGRHYLYGRQVTVAFHASFAIADDEGDKYCQSAGIVVKLESIAAQIFMTRANRFQLGITAGGLPYASYYDKGGTWRMATAGEALETGVWYELAMTAGNGFVYLYVDGVRKAGVTGFYGRPDPGSGSLVVAVSGGLYSTFYLFGDTTDGSSLLRGSTSGTWSKVTALTTRHTLRKVIVDSAIGEEHSGTITFAFADAEANLDYVPVLTFNLQDQAAWTYWPPEKGLKAGTYVKITIQLTARSWDRDVPIVDYVTATFCDCVTSLYDYEGYEETPAYEEVLPVPELPIPEDLNGLIQEIIRQREQITELQRSDASLGLGLDGLGDAVGNLAQRIGAYITAPDMGTGVPGYRLYYKDTAKLCEELLQRIQVNESQLFGVASLVPPLMSRMARLEGMIPDVAAMLLDGGDIDNAIDALIAAHNEDVYDVHGIEATVDLVNSEEMVSAISSHAGYSYGVHGSSGIEDPLMSDSDVDSLIAAHSDKDYGVHGCANLVSDMEDDVESAIAGHLATHVAAPDPHTGYCLESDGYATDAEVTTAISNHCSAADPHTGYCLESAGYATDAEVSAAITIHDESVAAHAGQGWVDQSDINSALSAHIHNEGSYGCGNWSP